MMASFISSALSSSSGGLFPRHDHYSQLAVEACVNCIKRH